jgi:hypothetical protein
MAVNDHEVGPSIAVTRLLAPPGEARSGSACVCGACIHVRGINRHQFFEGVGD